MSGATSDTAAALVTAEVALEPEAFYESLLDELRTRRATVSVAERSFGAEREMEGRELIEWVSFQAWYEREAAAFIGAWLRDVPEEDAFYGLTRQVADEGTHHHLLVRHLATLGASLDGWEPEPEWVTWVQVFYPAGDDTLERVSAHNVTGEIGAMQAFESLLPRLPAATRSVVERIIPDERFHVALGRSIVARYCTTADAQARVRRRVLDAFALEQAGRLAFERRLAALGC